MRLPVPMYRYAIPEVFGATFEVEHQNDADATAYALQIAAELSQENHDIVGQSLKVMHEGRLIAHLTIGRLH